MTRHTKLLLPLAGAALALAALFPAASQPAKQPVPRTFVSESGRIRAFAQDSTAVAWIDADYAVHVRRVAARRGSIVGSALSEYTHMPWPLALAGTQALWTSYSAGNFIYTSVHTGSPTLSDRVVYDSSYMPGTADGSWLRGGAGDGSTLVFGKVDQRCDVEWNCRRLDASGAVERVGTGAQDLVGLPAPFLLAASAEHVALVPAKTPRLFPDIGPPRAAEYAPVQVYDLGGKLISSFAPDGTPRAIALAWPKLALLFEFVDGSRQVELRDARTGGYWNAGGEAVVSRVPVTVGHVGVGTAGIVYSVGNRIYALRRQLPKLVARSVGTPIGLSVEGRRIAWAENVHGKGRIRTLTVTTAGSS